MLAVVFRLVDLKDYIRQGVFPPHPPITADVLRCGWNSEPYLKGPLGPRPSGHQPQTHKGQQTLGMACWQFGWADTRGSSTLDPPP